MAFAAVAWLIDNWRPLAIGAAGLVLVALAAWFLGQVEAKGRAKERAKLQPVIERAETRAAVAEITAKQVEQIADAADRHDRTLRRIDAAHSRAVASLGVVERAAAAQEPAAAAAPVGPGAVVSAAYTGAFRDSVLGLRYAAAQDDPGDPAQG